MNAALTGLNPRWVNYARVHGRTPDDQLQHDRKAYPGGSMAGFIIWGREQAVAFGNAHPEAFVVGGRLVDHEAYDRWLDALLPPVERLPEGLWERGDDLMFTCLSCGQDTVLPVGPDEFDPAMAYCGGSPRCLP